MSRMTPLLNSRHAFVRFLHLMAAFSGRALPMSVDAAANAVSLGGGLNVAVPLSVGTLQWGTTAVDQYLVNTGGCISEREAHAITAAFARAGVTLFDTAEGYGGGTSEKRLGRCAAALPPSSPSLLMMTKFLPLPWHYSHACLERELRASLQRLGTSCVDVYLLHTPVHWRPVEFWVHAAAICKRKGLLRAFGVSNCNAEQVRRAHRAAQEFGVPLVLNQVMYSLLDYASADLQHMERTCRELGVAIVAYSPIGQGLLTDGLTPAKLAANRPAKMTGLTWDKLEPIRTAIKRIAEKHNKSMAQVAINWCIQHGTIPLVGCRSVKQAEDTLGSLGWKLSPDEVEQLDQKALARSTLASPTWRRSIFVVLAGAVMHVCRFLDLLGFGMVSQSR